MSSQVKLADQVPTSGLAFSAGADGEVEGVGEAGVATTQTGAALGDIRRIGGEEQAVSANNEASAVATVARGMTR